MMQPTKVIPTKTSQLLDQDGMQELSSDQIGHSFKSAQNTFHLAHLVFTTGELNRPGKEFMQTLRVLGLENPVGKLTNRSVDRPLRTPLRVLSD